MCDFEPDDVCPVWDESERTARVEHTCSGCQETIEPGHRYRRTATLWAGSWSKFKHCLRCAAMVDAIAEHRPEIFSTDVLSLDCGELWVDVLGEPPPEVAALAFVLPGEAP